MADIGGSDPLPDYKNPPVVETVLGVQFERLSRFKNAHLGAFWKVLNATEWTVVADAPLLATQFERFDGATGWERALHLQLTQDPSSRLQIRNADGNRMIQLQSTRLHFNWLARPNESYPRYDTIRTEFMAVLQQFRKFVAQEQLGEVQLNQWEVTYVNEIPQGTVWTTPADWRFFRLLSSLPTVGTVIEGESFSGEWHFRIPEKRGRLHVEWQHGMGSRDRSENRTSEVIRLTLTARGPIASAGNGGDSMLQGLDLGRSTIVRSFCNLMSPKANRYWGLRNHVS